MVDLDVSKIIDLEDNGLNRIVLLIFCILSPAGSVYILFSEKIGELSIFNFLLFTFGFSSAIIVFYMFFTFEDRKIRNNGFIELVTLASEHKKYQRKQKKLVEESIAITKNIISIAPATWFKKELMTLKKGVKGMKSLLSTINNDIIKK